MKINVVKIQFKSLLEYSIMNVLIKILHSIIANKKIKWDNNTGVHVCQILKQNPKMRALIISKCKLHSALIKIAFLLQV